jgi:acyl-coenzyme A thioesterase PaaI-like protein
VTDEPKPFSEAYGTLEALGQLAAVWNTGPPMKHFGARLEFPRIDRVRAVIDPVQMFHRGGMGTDAVNGVVLAGLFDLVIGTVGWLTRPDTRSATVNLTMSFFKPTRGEKIAAEGRLIRSGINLIFAAAEILDGTGEVTARCDGTCAVAHGKHDNQELYERMRAGKIAP